MQTMFTHSISDQYGVWSSAVARASDIEVFNTNPTSYKLKATLDDTYRRVETEADDAGVSIPDALTYSVEYWPGYELKQTGWPGQTFTIDGKSVITIDMSSPEIVAEWDEFNGTAEDAIVHLAQWHFKEVIGK
ncbi:MAG: hypothetical protein K0U78_04615 [Actinomycetia bacterium]|nr:hypothetical protein [Actinomycetes bacterium]